MFKKIVNWRRPLTIFLCFFGSVCVIYVLKVKLLSLEGVGNKQSTKPKFYKSTISKFKKPIPSTFQKSVMNFRVKEISCAKLFKADAKEQEKALKMSKFSYRGPTLPLERFAKINCKSFVRERGYITTPLTSEEENFPIAYSIIAFKDIGQVERLLRAIYHPQNAYCFHADKKSPKEFRDGLRRLASCFPNVIMSSRSVDVKWGRWTNLECDLICMKDLLKRFPKWKYLINLTGQEFPLRTNLEVVRILKKLNGRNNMSKSKINPDRIPKKRLDFPVEWTKGAVHIVAVRKFIGFLFQNKKALKIANLLKDMPNPDETLFSTLQFNTHLGAPGRYLGDPKIDGKYRYIGRLKNWGDMPCKSGRRVRLLCIWGVKDLPLINTATGLFINKLYWNFQPLTLDCLEERIFNNTWRDYYGLKPPLNLDPYKQV